MAKKQLQRDVYFLRPPGQKGDLVHSVQRALSVLSLVAEHPQGLSGREISTRLRLNISTCYHILNTLQASGYIDRHPHSPVYLLGPQIPFLNNAVETYLDSHPLTPSGPNTITQKSRFIDQLNDIVRQGYAIDREEFLLDTCCIAAPIFAPQGQVVAALSISLTTNSLAKRAEWLIAQVCRAANHARAELRVAPIYQNS